MLCLNDNPASELASSASYLGYARKYYAENRIDLCEERLASAEAAAYKATSKTNCLTRKEMKEAITRAHKNIDEFRGIINARVKQD